MKFFNKSEGKIHFERTDIPTNGGLPKPACGNRFTVDELSFTQDAQATDCQRCIAYLKRIGKLPVGYAYGKRSK